MKKENEELYALIAELTEKVSSLSERQNSQYTDMMLLLKKIEERLSIDAVDVRSEDDLYDEAKYVVIEMQKASTSLIQRVLGIGYSRSAKLMDRLEAEGVISKANGSKPREVLLKEE